MTIPVDCALGELATFIRGLTFKPEDVVPLSDVGAIACMRTKNVQVHLDQDDVWGIPASFVNRDEQYLQEGDLLVSSANSSNIVGKGCWVPHLPWKATFGGFIAALRPNRKSVDPRYLFHWYTTERTQSEIRACGRQTTNISNLDLNRVLKLPVPLFPLSDQRRIAAILDNAEVLRAKRRVTLAKLDTLAQSIFIEMFGDTVKNPKNWPVSTLGALIQNGPQNGLYKPSELYGEGTPILRIDGFYAGTVTNLATLKRLMISPQEIETYRLRANDIVVNRVNSPEYLGKCALISELAEPTVFESNMMRFSVDETRLHPRYLTSALQGASIRAQILGRAKHAINQSSINQKDVAGFIVQLPPIQHQRQFADRMTCIDKQTGHQRLQLSRFEALFASLQHRAFRGEL